MTELFHVQRSLKSKAKIRWMVRALKLSRYGDFPDLYHQMEEKIHRAIKRKGEIDREECHLIIENVLWAKIFRRLQSWKLKSYVPVPGQADIHQSDDRTNGIIHPHCSIFKEHHYRFGKNPAILLPGFVPEGNEAYYLLRHSFLKHGPAYYINFPKDQYHSESVYHELYDLISNINQRRIKTVGRKEAPFLVGTSFGCAVIYNFMKWLKKNDLESSIQIGGLIFLSPVLCMEDVCIPGERKQPTLVARAIAPLLTLDEENEEEITKAMARAKVIFSKMFKAGQKQLDASSKQGIPVLAIEEEVLGFFNISETGLRGYFKRYLCLRRAGRPEATFVSNIPTLVLLAEGERDVLMPSSPALGLLGNQETLQTMFPNGEQISISSGDPKRKVTHSDLIFNAESYRKHLDPWLMKRVKG